MPDMMTLDGLVQANSNEMPDTVGNSDVREGGGQSPAFDEQALLTDINDFYTRGRQERRPHEGAWFVNAAMIRGMSRARWNPVMNVLENRKAPSHRSNDSINLILPKVKAKLSKFLKARAIPIVQPASTDQDDILNAKATTQLLEYLWSKLRLEEKYEEALLWAMQTAKCFWWFRWNQNAMAQVKAGQDPLTGKDQVQDAQLGEPEVEIGSAFEVIVADPGIARIQAQPRIQRVKIRKTKDIEQMFGLPAGTLEPEVAQSDLFQYQKQIAELGAKSGYAARMGQDKGEATHSLVKEDFTAPCAAYPLGRYVVAVANKVLHFSEELPYDLANSFTVFPVVEFSDMLLAGQFWPTTMVEQLIAGQQQYNRLRNGVDEHLKLLKNPKMFVPKQAGIHKDAWNSEAGEKIPINWQPGMPPPSQWVVQPPNIAGDVWRALDTIKSEMDMVSNLYPAAMGGGGATSGYDTNLLQEAADSVHAPDIRRNELALRDAAFILRRLAKLGFDIPRLISIVGKDKQPEVFEFSSSQIDEHADITIDTGSALPTQKHARIEAILKLDERQAFGPPGDPQRNRKLLRMLDLGSAAETSDLIGIDEDHARLENLSFTRNEPVEDPMPWEDHDVEYEIHTALLKSPVIKTWPPEQRQALVRHTILHVKWKNPQNALQLAAVFGMQDVVAEIQQTMMIQQSVVAPPPPAGPSAPQGQAPQPAPQGPPAPPAA
jgi:hypothetical protein